MKKMNNKGFSLVELIIVIAIMAILAGAIAPALIRYIDKSRRSNDVSSADIIETTLNTALGNESISEYLAEGGNVIITLNPGVKFADGAAAIKYTASGSCGADKAYNITAEKTLPGGTWVSSSGKDAAACADLLADELGQSFNGTVPKLKFKKDAETKKKEDMVFYALITSKGTVEIYIGVEGKEGSIKYTDADLAKICDGSTTGTAGIFEVAPEVCDSYN